MEKSNKWGKKVDIVNPGKYEGRSLESLRKEREEQKRKKNPDEDKLRELNFAIRAKTGWGTVTPHNKESSMYKSAVPTWLQSVADTLKDHPQILTGLAGAGIGGLAGGLLGKKKRRLEAMLLGMLLGGGAGYGAGMIPDVTAWTGKRLGEFSNYLHTLTPPAAGEGTPGAN